MKKFLAGLTSALLHPILMPLYGILMYYFYEPAGTVMPQVFRLVTVSLVAVFMVLLPTIWFLILNRVGVVSNLGATERSERNWLYIFTLACYIITVAAMFFVRYLGVPTDPVIIVVLIGATLALATTTIVNAFWKISAHATGIGGITGATFFVTYCYCDNALWIYCTLLLLSGVVMWARLQLNSHTPAQLAAGYLSGLFFCCAVPFLILTTNL